MPDSFLIETELGWLVMPDPCSNSEDVIHEVHYMGPKTGWNVYRYALDFRNTTTVKP